MTYKKFKNGDFMMNKRAQVSTLILLMMIVLVFYVLLLPPAEREKILGDEDTAITGTGTSKIEKLVLLSADIGAMDYVKEKEIEHTLVPVLLEERANAVVLSELSPFNVRKGWFSSKTKNVAFNIENLEITEKVLLSFQLDKKIGTLRIKLNDIDIFDSPVAGNEPVLVELKKNALQKVNTLNFEVYGLGIFAREYQFKDVKIVADIVDASRRSSMQTFIVSPEEKNNLQSGYVSFYGVCSAQQVGTLTVALNDKVLFSGTPNCNSINRFETIGTDFAEGRNQLKFDLPSGSARLDSVLAKTKLKPTKSFIDYFNVNSTVYSQLNSKKTKTLLRVEFVDNGKQKTADVNINGVLSTIDQSASKYEKDITSKVRENNNYISLTPRTELNVVNLKVSVE